MSVGNFVLSVRPCNTPAAGCVNWEMRLVEGQTEWEGRLEVCYNRRWGTVGSERWSQVNSRVVCNTLGYDSTGANKILLGFIH